MPTTTATCIVGIEAFVHVPTTLLHRGHCGIAASAESDTQEYKVEHEEAQLKVWAWPYRR